MVLDSRELVNDEIVVDIVRERLARPDAAAGFILDGIDAAEGIAS